MLRLKLPATRPVKHTSPKRLSLTATQAKNQFGQLLERAISGDRIWITKHDAPKAVLLSADDFSALSGVSEARIDTLSAEFDQLLAEMQKPNQRRAVRALFNATPKQLGAAAVQAARKRG